MLCLRSRSCMICLSFVYFRFTGVPKGCMLEYGNITAFCHWFKRYYGIDSECRIAAYASFGFDACMMDIYGAITNGAQLHIIPEEIRLDFIGLQRYFEENGITHSFMTTQVGSSLRWRWIVRA